MLKLKKTFYIYSEQENQKTKGRLMVYIVKQKVRHKRR